MWLIHSQVIALHCSQLKYSEICYRLTALPDALLTAQPAILPVTLLTALKFYEIPIREIPLERPPLMSDNICSIVLHGPTTVPSQ